MAPREVLSFPKLSRGDSRQVSPRGFYAVKVGRLLAALACQLSAACVKRLNQSMDFNGSTAAIAKI